MRGLRRAANVGILVALALVVGTAGVAAQSNDEYEKVFPFLGHWDSRINNPDGQDRGNCGGRTGDYGEKLLNCSMPVEQLPLNARGEAWMKFVDLLQSPTTVECAEVGLPSALEGDFSLSAAPGQVVIDSSVARTIWMNGTGPTPRQGELYQHGYSVGRFDGADLVVETTHFMFDPDGTDDHLHMASSVRKKVTERYHVIDDDNIRLIITLDDPTFLTKPFTYSKLFARTTSRNRNAGWSFCDPDVARGEVEFAYPGTKYSEGQKK